MSSVEIVMIVSMVTTVTASVGYCWWHFHSQKSQPVVKQDA